MPGRRIPPEDEFGANIHGFIGSEFARRRLILKETLQAFRDAEPLDRYALFAMENLRRWKGESSNLDSHEKVLVIPGDWGEVTLSLTEKYGTCFAVLNMANAYVPGGAYVEGAVAQEENMFRRTDCHFRVGEDEYDVESDCYQPSVTRLLQAKDGVVYLDTDQPRVCIRGPEDRSKEDLGYKWLPDERVFPFFELRASAQDLRNGSPFNKQEARQRIAAQLNTLAQRSVRHVVLSAFGCGAFQNPAHDVAQLYREEIEARPDDFSVIAFAIFAPGYGPDNYTPFAEAFGLV